MAKTKVNKQAKLVNLLSEHAKLKTAFTKAKTALTAKERELASFGNWLLGLSKSKKRKAKTEKSDKTE